MKVHRSEVKTTSGEIEKVNRVDPRRIKSKFYSVSCRQGCN